MILAIYVAATAEDPLVFLLNFGTLGVVFVLLLSGWLFTKPYVQRLEKECIEKDKIIALFSNQLQMHTIPALAQTTRVMEAIPSVDQGLVKEIQRLNQLLEQRGTP